MLAHLRSSKKASTRSAKLGSKTAVAESLVRMELQRQLLVGLLDLQERDKESVCLLY